MIVLKVSNIKIPPKNDAFSEEHLIRVVRDKLRIDRSRISAVKLLRKSLDARKKNDIHYVVTLSVEADNMRGIKVGKDVSVMPKQIEFVSPVKKSTSTPVIVGMGPAGLFAGLVLARTGMNPVILERGQDVDDRKKSIEKFLHERMLNTESNVQFGEGGAGTFSDGKLTTGIKTPYMSFIFEEFVKHGAPSEILYDAKPHIGTDRLAPTIKSIRQEIISLGGRVIFNARFTDFNTRDGKINTAVYEHNGETHEIPTDNIILATGHSARDIYELLKNKNINISPKPFSVGVRIEHLQSDLNRSMYGEHYGSDIKKYGLPPAEYKLSAHLPSGRSVYSFCMCPGGYVTASSSETGGLVTNGMSYYNRNAVNANSAVLVGVGVEDLRSNNPLAGIEFQREIEKKAFISGGSNYNAPVFMTGDFLERKISESIGRVKPSYLPGYKYTPPDEYLPDFVTQSLREALLVFDKKIKGFASPDSILTGAETRSSSPVRINRAEDCQSVSVSGLYPCGEGAGYAGGIVSAAVDGIRVAVQICNS